MIIKWLMITRAARLLFKETLESSILRGLFFQSALTSAAPQILRAWWLHSKLATISLFFECAQYRRRASDPPLHWGWIWKWRWIWNWEKTNVQNYWPLRYHRHIQPKRLKIKWVLLYRAHSCYPGSFNLSATVAFQRSFTEKEVDVRANFKALYEIHICQK